MSILTKTCIVVLVVVVLLACPVFIKQAMVTPNYKGLWEKEQRRSALLLQYGEHTRLALNKSQYERNEATKRADDADAAKLEDGAKAHADIVNLRLAKTEAEARARRLDVDNAVLANMAKDAMKRLDDALALNSQYRTKIAALGQANASIADLLAAARASLRSANELAKVYRDREAVAVRDLEEAKEVIAKYIAEKGPLKGGTDGQPGTVKIRATILAVREGIASINAGAAKGVKPGMRLVVYRNAQFVGWLKVIEVEAQEAAGLVTDTAPGLEAQRGDKVTTEAGVSGTVAGG